MITTKIEQQKTDERLTQHDPNSNKIKYILVLSYGGETSICSYQFLKEYQKHMQPNNNIVCLQSEKTLQCSIGLHYQSL